MRYVLILPGLLMVAFAAVQYNDPDTLVWATIYLVPAAWCFAAAFRPASVQSLAGERLLWVSVSVGAALTVFYWPTMPNFWVKDVWWVEETAREGMGMMIAFAVLLAVLAATLLRKRAA
jgi:transmembrane protein TMEM220